MALQQAFPDFFDVIGNMSVTYDNRTNPQVLPVQHAQHKVLVEHREQIECTLNDMIEKGVIVPIF